MAALRGSPIYKICRIEIDFRDFNKPARLDVLLRRFAVEERDRTEEYPYSTEEALLDSMQMKTVI